MIYCSEKDETTNLFSIYAVIDKEEKDFFNAIKYVTPKLDRALQFVSEFKDYKTYQDDWMVIEFYITDKILGIHRKIL